MLFDFKGFIPLNIKTKTLFNFNCKLSPLKNQSQNFTL
ncbi:hypothetical protein HPHPA16_0005 [Helicobacter pylori Hp A-16]|nr:hypothetical protein HPHPA16_0005 [Helicobacter pylori Hp A-16]